MTPAHIDDYVGKSVFMVGIGGSSMSGLAELLLHRGMRVLGSDRTRSHATDRLILLGIPVQIGHSEGWVIGSDLVVYTAAIPEDNPERAAAKRLGIPQIERSELLGQLSEGYRTIAVAGAHGKSTVTSMLATVFTLCDADPTVHIGGELPLWHSSVRTGNSDLFITEACEFAESFLTLKPWLSVILNIDADHLDWYHSIENIEAAFQKYIDNTRPDGVLVACAEDARVMRLVALERQKPAPRKVLTYGLSADADVALCDLVLDDLGAPTFTVLHRGKRLFTLTLKILGDHNALNALATIACALECGLDPARVKASLEAFTGVSRRFELTGEVAGVKLYHDYGHHPNEFRTVVPLAKRIPHRKYWVVFQPHTYSRTKLLFDDFPPSFEGADEVVVTDIYAAREQDPGDIHATQVVASIAKAGIKATYCATFAEAKHYLVGHWQPGDVVLTLGCGNINLLNEQLAE